MIIILAFIFGLLIGSFLNAVIYRLYRNLPLGADRSMCPHCKHVLSPLDLVPILSFIWLRGRCRYCKAKISWQYPIVELLTGISFALLAYNYGLRITDYGFWFQLAFIAFLILIAVFDLKYYLILDKVSIPAIVLAVIWRIVSDFHSNNFGWHSPLAGGVFGAVIISGFFGLQYLASRGRWIGLGDVKLGLFLGLIFGVGQGLVYLLLSYWIGALVGLVLVAANQKKMSGKLPFGTILGFSGIIMLLYGSSLLAWYLHLVGF
ncbi:MAG TPA: prepilin peptidase [Patescibacteria group bacterium]|nr:prepilin peptidase [Patescibacteria group bacterium]